MSKSLDNQVFLTVAYTDQFQYPLHVEEVYLRLIFGKKLNVKKLPGFAQVKKSLSRLAKKGKLVKQDDWFALQEKNFKIREQREKLSQAKVPAVMKFVKLARKIPWIKAVAVTGSLALVNSTENSDLDLMIVTKKNRLWLTRLLVTLVAGLKGKRRSWRADVDFEDQEQDKDRWCFNIWLDEDNLDLPEEKQSLYTAYEVCQAGWVFDRGNMQAKFYEQNQWVEQFVPIYFYLLLDELEQLAQEKKAVSFVQTFFDFNRGSLTWQLISFFDWLAYLLQRGYMSRHMTREQVGRGFAYFHPRDTKGLIYKRWKKSLKKLI